MKKLLFILCLFCMTINASIVGPTGKNVVDLRTLGDEKAPIKMFIFSSLTCPHCSIYHEKVLPEIYEKYIKTGEIYLTYVDFPFDGKSMAGFMLARCIPSEKYFDFLSGLYKSQSTWQENTKDFMKNYVKMFGMTEDEFNTCLENKGLASVIETDRNTYQKKYNIKGMPTTVLVYGNKTRQVMGADLNAVINAIGELK